MNKEGYLMVMMAVILIEHHQTMGGYWLKYHFLSLRYFNNI